jgi:hypothetical protein
MTQSSKHRAAGLWWTSERIITSNIIESLDFVGRDRNLW